MALDCLYNVTGLAYNTLHGLIITNFVFIVFLILCIILLRDQLVTVCDKLYFYKHFNATFKKIYRVFQIIHGLYWVVRQCHQFHVPKLRSKQITQGLSLQVIQTAPPTDKCIAVVQTRPTLILTEPSPLLAPPAPQTLALQQDRVTEELETETSLTPTDNRSSDKDTLICQVQPLLGTTHRENLQLRNRNRPEDIIDVLGTNAFQGYVNTPLQTLDGIVVQQPKGFLPLAEEAKHVVEEILIEKLNEQWAGIPHEKLLNQSFHDQLNSLQILEHLAPLELAKQHLPADIIDILEHLGKVDNIPFNQLYYIAENCADLLQTSQYSRRLTGFTFTF